MDIDFFLFSQLTIVVRSVFNAASARTHARRRRRHSSIAQYIRQ